MPPRDRRINRRDGGRGAGGRGAARRGGDLGGLAAGRREAELCRRLAEEASRPFDLTRGPLFRTVLLRLGTEEHVLLLDLHHAVADGWSLTILRRELAVSYSARLAWPAGEPSPLAELPIQYADFAAWQ